VIKAKDLRKKTKVDLEKLLKKTNTDLQKAVSQILQGKEKNVNKPKELRKDIARILTVLNGNQFAKEAPKAKKKASSKKDEK